VKPIIAILFFAILVSCHVPARPKPVADSAPRIGFADTKDATAIVDTDLFDEQKYVEEAGGDSTAVKAKRAAHEAALMREFMNGFSAVKECDRIVIMGAGDQKPDFSLRLMVDSHDLQDQKPVWVWMLREVRTDKLFHAANEDSGKQAAADVCRAVWNVVDPEQLKKIG
jgi:hypothetical protein